MPASKSVSSRIESASAYQCCVVYRETIQTRVVFWRIPRSDGIRCGPMWQKSSGLREGVYVFVDGLKKTRDGFFRILEEDGIWYGKTWGDRDGGPLVLRKGQ